MDNVRAEDIGAVEAEAVDITSPEIISALGKVETFRETIRMLIDDAVVDVAFDSVAGSSYSLNPSPRDFTFSLSCPLCVSNVQAAVESAGLPVQDFTQSAVNRCLEVLDFDNQQECNTYVEKYKECLPTALTDNGVLISNAVLSDLTTTRLAACLIADYTGCYSSTCETVATCYPSDVTNLNMAQAEDTERVLVDITASDCAKCAITTLGSC